MFVHTENEAEKYKNPTIVRVHRLSCVISRWKKKHKENVRKSIKRFSDADCTLQSCNTRTPQPDKTVETNQKRTQQEKINQTRRLLLSKLVSGDGRASRIAGASSTAAVGRWRHDAGAAHRGVVRH